MRRTVHFSLITLAIVASLALAPRPAQAQWHGHGGTHVVVGFGFGWGYPYWGWGYPYWGWGGWGYPYSGWGPYWGGHAHAPDNSAELKLEVKPKDAQVYVDGYYVGIVDDFNGSFERLHVPPGDHELVLYKPGFKTVKQTIRVGAGQDSKIKYQMQPLAAGETAEAPPQPPAQPPQREQPRQQRPPRGYPRTAPPDRMPPYEAPPPAGQAPPAASEARGFGTLVCRVQPSGAEILIDGERWQGPEGEERLVVQLAEGSHRVEIRKNGFVTFTSDVTVRGGETTPLNVSLPPR